MGGLLMRGLRGALLISCVVLLAGGLGIREYLVRQSVAPKQPSDLDRLNVRVLALEQAVEELNRQRQDQLNAERWDRRQAQLKAEQEQRLKGLPPLNKPPERDETMPVVGGFRGMP
jgi:hypothetical protein